MKEEWRRGMSGEELSRKFNNPFYRNHQTSRYDPLARIFLGLAEASIHSQAWICFSYLLLSTPVRIETSWLFHTEGS